MAIGASGRVVIEIEPELKQLLHFALQQEGMTLKEWFVENANEYVYRRRQLTLNFSGVNDSTRETKDNHLLSGPTE